MAPNRMLNMVSSEYSRHTLARPFTRGVGAKENWEIAVVSVRIEATVLSPVDLVETVYPPMERVFSDHPQRLSCRPAKYQETKLGDPLNWRREVGYNCEWLPLLPLMVTKTTLFQGMHYEVLSLFCDLSNKWCSFIPGTAILLLGIRSDGTSCRAEDPYDWKRSVECYVRVKVRWTDTPPWRRHCHCQCFAWRKTVPVAAAVYFLSMWNAHVVATNFAECEVLRQNLDRLCPTECCALLHKKRASCVSGYSTIHA